MDTFITGRFAEEIRHVDTFLELLSLVDFINTKEAVDQMLLKILAVCKGETLAIENSVRLKLALLCRYRLQVKYEADRFPLQRCKSIVNACLFQPQDEFKLINLEALEITLGLLDDGDLIEISSELIQLVQSSLENYMNTGVCVHENAEVSPLFLLNILEKIIRLLSKRFSPRTLESNGFQETLNIASIGRILIEVAVVDYGIISSNVLTSLIPVVLEVFSNCTMLSELWLKLTTIWKGDNWEEADYNRIYLVLSSVANLIFESSIASNGKQSFILVQDNRFWEIILFGIGQKNPTVRKQSRFLLRKALDYIITNSSQVCLHISTNLFFWDNDCGKDYYEAWNEYFLILEALEEKQVHLIEPLLNLFETLLKNHSSCVSIAWALPLYQRMFCHDSNQIVKYGLHSFLSLNISLFVSANCKIVSFLLNPLLVALNNTHLYTKQGEKEYEIEYCFTKMLYSLSECSTEDQNLFYEEILLRFSKVPWGPVPLFYLMKSFSSLILHEKVWKVTNLKNLQLFITNSLHTHNIYIRGAIQSCALKAMINFINSENLCINDLTDVIGSFSGNESLRRGSYSWNILVEWFKKIFDNDKALTFVSSYLTQLNNSSISELQINERSMARMIILLCDSYFLLENKEMSKSDKFHHLMSPLLRHLESLDSRPYASDTLVGTAICFLSNMLDECSALPENDSTLDAIISVIIPLMKCIIWYSRKKLFILDNELDFKCMNVLMKAFNIFVKEEKLLYSFLEHSDGLIDDAYHILESDKNLILCRYFSFQILVLCGNALVSSRCYWPDILYVNAAIKYRNKLSVFVQHLLQKKLINQCDAIKNAELNYSGEMTNFKGQIITDYIKSCWSMIYYDLITNSRAEELIFVVRDMNQLIEDAIESLEIGGREVLKPVMSVFQILLPKAMENSYELSWKFCNLCWKAVLDHRKSDFFWVAFKDFIEMIFQFKIMILSHYQINVTQLSQELLTQSQAVGRIFRLLINQLHHETCKHGTLIWKNYYNLLVDSLTYGPVLRKDQKIYKDTCEYIQSFGNEYTVNSFLTSDYFSDTSVRIKGLSIMISIMECELNGIPEAKGMTELLADSISKRVLSNIDVKSRYYGNSNTHRQKQRALQCLLILENFISLEKRDQLLVSVCDSLSIESHQPSVKYLQEWLLVRILTHQPELLGKMWEIFKQVGLKRPGCMGSFIAVMYHLTKTIPFKNLEQFVKECLHHILPCCMAQQFSVRLHAQVVIHKLWELLLCHNFRNVMKEYKITYDCLNSGFDQANNVLKNLKKLKENFYFDVFHPDDHFSLETIYYEIPRLSNVSADEWICVSELEILKSNDIIPLHNANDLLKQEYAGDWVAKSNDLADFTTEKSSNLQKKIMPWKFCNSHAELDLFSEEFNDSGHRIHKRNQKRSGGLIVVASLIDRMPNLGGLCRTCEAFNVSEYVLGSLKYIEDKQFQNLSVTAENWIPISEIKPFMLTQYLKSMKEEGYALIGAEQTSNSMRLNDFKFPKKSLLLLGHEKGGIPADLLPLLDVCVEIPQEGVIRSLNVHVTGALFVWEYARQNSCTTQK